MTKKVPSNNYLLKEVSIKSDNKNIDKVYLEDFIRQKPNSSIPFLGRVRLGIFNYSGDTSKWLNRSIQKYLGQPPVIYNSRLATTSASQIQKELSNQGYLRNKVDTLLSVTGQDNKEIKVTYNIKSGNPYTIRNYNYSIDDSGVSRILGYTRKYSNIQKGQMFNQETLSEELDKRTNILRNLGYYKFTHENLYHKADTTVGDHQVDLTLALNRTSDSIKFNRYRFRDITIISGYDVTDDDNKENFQNPDTTYKNGVMIIHGKNNFLRNSMLLRNSYIRPGRFYSDMAISRTYTAFNGTGAVRQTNIDLTPVVEDSLYFIDAKISLAPGNVYWLQTGLDATNSAGDIGIAPSISYRHQNMFNGAEILNIKLKAAYEFVSGDRSTDVSEDNYYEYGIETSLSFPQFLFPWLKKSWREIPSASTQISLGLTNQHRSEYTRQFFNLGYTFRWSSKRNQLKHAFDFIDVNYVRMPWTSESFKDMLDNTNNKVLKATYDDQLIARTGYNIVYTKNVGRRFPRNTYTIRAGVDYAGWIPSLVKSITNLKKNENGQYQIAGIAYAEYFKADFSFSHTRSFDKHRSFAYRIALGFAQPFGNSNILPYEKRYFSGGANSVRGWNTRRLGPGSYQPNQETSFINQAGDIKLDLNVEYRNKIGDFFELAGFIDAGNIWTIKDYQGQEGGQFKLDKFYKEIAVAYGFGLRLDLDFLLLRLDYGLRVYDPSRNESKFRLLKPRMNETAWHFGIGYPF